MILQLIAPFSDLISWVVEHMGSGEFLPSNWLMDLIADFVCGETLVTMMIMMAVVDISTSWWTSLLTLFVVRGLRPWWSHNVILYRTKQPAWDYLWKCDLPLDWLWSVRLLPCRPQHIIDLSFFSSKAVASLLNSKYMEPPATNHQYHHRQNYHLNSHQTSQSSCRFTRQHFHHLHNIHPTFNQK